MAWNRSVEPQADRKTAAAGAKRKYGLAVVCFALVVAVGCCLWFSFGGGRTTRQTREVKQIKLIRGQQLSSKSARDAVSDAMPAKLPKTVRQAGTQGDANMFDHLQGEDRKLAEAVQAALDANDFRTTLAAAQAALKSANSEVRVNAVEALGWFGAEALPALTGLMTDADEEVRDAAGNQWENALQELEEPKDRLNVSLAAFGALSDADRLTTLAGILSGAANEVIDGADDAAAASESRQKVLQSLVDIIGSGSKVNVKAAKEVYGDITGHEWRGVDEAERYLADPDNYEEPES